MPPRARRIPPPGHAGEDRFVGISGGESASAVTDGLRDRRRKTLWRGYSMGPDSDTLIDPEKTTHLGKPVAKDSGPSPPGKAISGRSAGPTWGWYSLRSGRNLVYYGTATLDLEPTQRPGDNRWSYHFCARCRYAHGQMALPDDAP